MNEKILEEFENVLAEYAVGFGKYATLKNANEFLSEKLDQARAEERERVVEELFEIEKTKGKDAKHCTCLGYAIIQVVGGEDSKEGKEMIKRFSSLDNPK